MRLIKAADLIPSRLTNFRHALTNICHYAAIDYSMPFSVTNNCHYVTNYRHSYETAVASKFGYVVALPGGVYGSSCSKLPFIQYLFFLCFVRIWLI